MLYISKWAMYWLVFCKIALAGSTIIAMPKHKKVLSNDAIALERAQKDRAMQQLKINMVELILPTRYEKNTNAEKIALWNEYEKNNGNVLRSVLEASQGILKCLTYSREIHADVVRAEARARDMASVFLQIADVDLPNQLLVTDDTDAQALSRWVSEFIDHYRRGVLDFENNRDYQFTYNTDDDKRILQEVVSNKDNYSQQAYSLATTLLAMVDMYEAESEVYRKKNLMNDFVAALTASTQRYCTAVATSKCQSMLTHMISQYFGHCQRAVFSPTDKESVKNLEQKFSEHLNQVNRAVDELHRKDAEQKHREEQSAAAKLAIVQNKKKRNKKNKECVVFAPNTILSDSATSNSEQVTEEPLVVREEGCIGFSCDAAQRLFILGQEILSVGKPKERDVVRESRTPSLLSTLRIQPPINNYARNTVMDWFENPKKALQREMVIPEYRRANATEEQRQQNIIAHTFPFQIDAFIEKLATKLECSDGSIRYAIPGSMCTESSNPKLGYFTWIVKNSCCVHRSFTIAPLAQRKDWTQSSLIQQVLHSKKDIQNILAQEQEEAVDIKQVDGEVQRSDGAIEVKTNGLTVTVKNTSSGTSCKLIIPRGL